MSSQLKEKQQQTDRCREFEADQLFNQHLFRTLAYAGAGFGAGMVASLFFKQKKMLTLLGTGAGAVYGGQGFMSDLNQYQRFKDMSNQGQQSQTLKREDQSATKNWENYLPKQESSSQQKRFGGSDDNENEKKGSKSNIESPGTATSNRNKDLDKSSYEFGKNKGASAKASSHNKETDKSSQHFGEQKSSGIKSFDPKESIEKTEKSQASKDHKEKNSNQHESQKSSSQTKQHEKINLSKTESQKSSSQTKSHEKDSKQLEQNGTGVREPHLNFREEGQQLQEFGSYKEPGKPAPGESRTNRGSERPRHGGDKDVGELKNQQNRIEQDRYGATKHTGNKMKLENPNENVAGGQFNGDGLSARSQVNAVIE